jgi:CRISPR-associated protein Csb2
MTRGDDDAVQAWRWRIEPPGPHLTGALPAMEAIRSAAAYMRHRMGYGHFPESFHGGDKAGHGHAFWIPEDEDANGFIDHIWVFCANGMDGGTIAALAGVEWFWAGDCKFLVAPSWMGPRPDGGLFGPSAAWRAITPYITPRRRLTKTGKERADETPEAQLLREFALRNLPTPSALNWRPATWCGEDEVLASQFAVEREKRSGPPPDALASFPELIFAEPVTGPLSFGYGAHFGLGVLLPSAFSS